MLITVVLGQQWCIRHFMIPTLPHYCTDTPMMYTKFHGAYTTIVVMMYNDVYDILWCPHYFCTGAVMMFSLTVVPTSLLHWCSKDVYMLWCLLHCCRITYWHNVVPTSLLYRYTTYTNDIQYNRTVVQTSLLIATLQHSGVDVVIVFYVPISQKKCRISF